MTLSDLPYLVILLAVPLPNPPVWCAPWLCPCLTPLSHVHARPPCLVTLAVPLPPRLVYPLALALPPPLPIWCNPWLCHALPPCLVYTLTVPLPDPPVWCILWLCPCLSPTVWWSPWL